eukprot:Rmarinus@m.19392
MVWDDVPFDTLLSILLYLPLSSSNFLEICSVSRSWRRACLQVGVSVILKSPRQFLDVAHIKKMKFLTVDMTSLYRSEEIAPLINSTCLSAARLATLEVVGSCKGDLALLRLDQYHQSLRQF